MHLVSCTLRIHRQFFVGGRVSLRHQFPMTHLLVLQAAFVLRTILRVLRGISALQNGEAFIFRFQFSISIYRHTLYTLPQIALNKRRRHIEDFTVFMGREDGSNKLTREIPTSTPQSVFQCSHFLGGGGGGITFHNNTPHSTKMTV